MKKLSLSVCLVISCALASAQEPIHGTVTDVVDGNTLVMKAHDGETYKILLHGIDSPEPGQRLAAESTEMLKKLLFNQKVTVTPHSRDRFGTRIGAVHIPGQSDPRHDMLRSGLAWPAEKHNDPQLEAIKNEAKAKSIGIWEEEDPTPPWTYRRQQTMVEAKSN
jgi:micrococcal nuclease